MLSPVIIAILALLVSFGAVAQYFATIPKGTVPEKPILLPVLLVSGIVLSICAIIKGIPGSVLSVIGIILLSIFPLLMGSFFLWILTQRKTPVGDIKVRVGDKILAFNSKTSDGRDFHSGDLLGKRTLFKFYRGGWCPYCSAELMLFNDMKEELSKFGVQVVALSGDTVEEAHTHKDRDHLNFTLLSDPRLSVVKQYGVEHHKALGGDTKDVAFSIAGIPFATKFRFKAMSIPTSLLVDEQGTILWIDQSEDYRLRASREAVLGAVGTAFGTN